MPEWKCWARFLSRSHAGEACLTADERELGVALVDIGGGTTDLIVYYAGVVRHTAVIPVGGEHFTNDIAVGLRTPIPEAEKMKKAWGERDPSKPADAMVEVPSVGERPSRVVTYATLSEIIEPRDVGVAGIDSGGNWPVRLRETSWGPGVVLTGGGAKLGSLADSAEPIFGMPVQVGIPSGLEAMGETLLTRRLRRWWGWRFTGIAYD